MRNRARESHKFFITYLIKLPSPLSNSYLVAITVFQKNKVSSKERAATGRTRCSEVDTHLFSAAVVKTVPFPSCSKVSHAYVIHTNKKRLK